jgi:hypothetical protein
MSAIRRWLDWQPGGMTTQIAEKAYGDELTKPTQLSSVSSVSDPPTPNSKIKGLPDPWVPSAAY